MSLSLNNNNTHISGICHGTPLYTAPEVVVQNKLSTAADLYSFGVILWELYHMRTAWQVCEKCVGGKASLNSMIGGHLARALRHEVLDRRENKPW